MSDTITLTGNLGADPERRTTHRGDTIAAFRVGSTHRRFDRESNAWVDAYTNWYAVSAFRGLGEHALVSLRKGDRVILTGTLRLREWDNGTKQGTTAEVEAEAIGHDLLWGSTIYQGSSGARGLVETSTGAEVEPGPSPAVETHSGLEGPGAQAGTSPAFVEAAQTSAPELQWAGAEDGEAPF